MTQRLTRENICRLLVRAARITGETVFVVVGSGAAILRLPHVPLDLAYTPDVDMYAPEATDIQGASDTIDFVIGIDSDFHVENGFYAHGVDQNTSSMPNDWMNRAKRLTASTDPEVICICPDIHDIAVAKLFAWRPKDRAWLRSAFESGLLVQTRILDLACHGAGFQVLPADEMAKRIAQAFRTVPGTSPLAGSTSTEDQ